MPSFSIEPKALLKLFSGSRGTLQRAHPDSVQCCRADPFQWGRVRQPCVTATSISQPGFSLPVAITKWQHQKPVPAHSTWSYLWHSCRAGDLPARGPQRPWCTLQAPGSCPGPELHYRRKDTFPKAVWGGERHHYTLTPAPPSKNSNKKKPQPGGCINANTELAAQAETEMAGHS